MQRKIRYKFNGEKSVGSLHTIFVTSKVLKHLIRNKDYLLQFFAHIFLISWQFRAIKSHDSMCFQYICNTDSTAIPKEY